MTRQPNGGDPHHAAGRAGRAEPGRRAGSRSAGPPRGPDVALLILALVGLVVAALALLQELAGVGGAGEWVGPAAAVAVGAALVLAGVVGLIRR